MTHKEQNKTTDLNTPITVHDESKRDNDFQSAKIEIMEEESISTCEGYSKLFIGDSQVIIDKVGEDKNIFDKSTQDHNAIPVEL